MVLRWFCQSNKYSDWRLNLYHARSSFDNFYHHICDPKANVTLGIKNLYKETIKDCNIFFKILILDLNKCF